MMKSLIYVVKKEEEASDAHREKQTQIQEQKEVKEERLTGSKEDREEGKSGRKTGKYTDITEVKKEKRT